MPTDSNRRLTIVRSTPGARTRPLAISAVCKYSLRATLRRRPGMGSLRTGGRRNRNAERFDHALARLEHHLQHAQKIAAKHLRHVVLAEPTLQQAVGDVDEIILVLEARDQPVLADAENLVLRIERTIVLDEVQAQSDVVDADEVGDMADVIAELVERRLLGDPGGA